MLRAGSDNSELERLRAENRYLRDRLAGQEPGPEVLSAAEQRGTASAAMHAHSSEELEQQVRLFDTALSSIADYVFICDLQGRITYANHARLHFWQRELKDVLGKTFFDLGYPHELAAQIHSQIETVIATKEPLRAESAFTDASGRMGYYDYILVPIFDTEGEVEAVSGSTRDMSDRHREQVEKETLLKTQRQAEAALRRSEELFRTTLHSIGDAVIATDTLGRITFMNRVAERLTGWVFTEAVGRASTEVFHIVHELTREDIPSPIAQVLRENCVVGLANHTVVLARDGKEYPIEDSGAPIQDDAGNLLGVVLVFRDVTEARRKEQAVQQSQARTRMIVESALDAVVEIGEDDRIAGWNAQAEQIFGWSRAEAVGQLLSETIIPARYRQAHLQGMQRYKETGQGPVLNQRIEITALHRNGHEFPVELAISPIESTGSNTFSAFIRDLTGQKQAEEQRRQSETRFRLLVEQSPLSIQILGPDGHTLQVNRAWEHLWGLTLDDVRDYNMLEDQQLMEKGIMPFIQRAFAGESLALPPVLYDPDETLPNRTRHTEPQRWTQAFMYPVKDDTGRIREVVLIHHDITQQKQAEQARAHLAAIIYSSTDAIISKDLQGIITSWNPAAERIYGYAAREVLGKSKSLLIPPEMPEELPTILRKIRAGERIEHYETLRVRKDGTRIHLSISVSPIHSADGQIIGASTIARDISERIQHLREIETLNARLRRSIQETHHRVKNNLQIISALTELQMEENQTMVPATALARIGQHTRSLAAVHDLLTQEAKADAHTDSISTKAALDKLIPLLQATTGGRRIAYSVDDFRMPVREGASLALLISELVSNAVKHGRNDIEVALVLQGDEARLEVCDDGPGFPPDFNWRKAANTGLGLIDSTGRYDLRGTISYENAGKGGGRVLVTFPVPPT